GMSPSLAMLRKQIRQMPNLRYTARGRPHSRQRSRTRILSRGRIFDLSGCRLLSSSAAICFLYLATFASVAMLVLLAPPPSFVTPRGSRGVTKDGGENIVSRLTERHAKSPQQLTRFIVVTGAGHEGHIHALDESYLIRINFGEHTLLGQPHAVVAVAVEAL